MGRPSVAAERRQQIIAALMRAMSKSGFAGTPIPEIARQAGLAPGLVHYYFKNKQEILLALLRSIHETAIARFERRLSEAGGDPWRRLAALCDALLEDDGSPAADHAAACWVVIAAEAVRAPRVRTLYRKIVAELVDRYDTLLSDVLRSQSRSNRNCRALAAATTAAVLGVYQIDTAAPAAASSAGSSAPLLKHMIEGLIAAQPQATPRRRQAGGGTR